MLGSGVGQPHAALGAQPRAVIGTQWRKRQLEHQRVPQGWLEIKQVPVQKIPVHVIAARVVSEQLREPDFRGRSKRLQAARTLGDQRCPHGGGHQYALGDALKLNIQLELGPFWNVNQLDTKISRSRGRTGQGCRRHPGLEDDIQAYIGSGEWRGKAGGYAVQGIAGTFVVKMVGSYTNIVGLPLYESVSLLGGEGFPIRFGWLNAS